MCDQYRWLRKVFLGDVGNRGKKKKCVTKFVVPYVRFLGVEKTRRCVAVPVVWCFCSVLFILACLGLTEGALCLAPFEESVLVVFFCSCVHQNRCNAQFAPHPFFPHFFFCCHWSALEKHAVLVRPRFSVTGFPPSRLQSKDSGPHRQIFVQEQLSSSSVLLLSTSVTFSLM